MNQVEQRNLALECGGYADDTVAAFSYDELTAYTLAVEARERERCANECDRMVMYRGGLEESAVHSNVWDAAKAIRELK